jgi:hypothetical protein
MDPAPLGTVRTCAWVVLVAIGNGEDRLWHGPAQPMQHTGRRHLAPDIIPDKQVDHGGVGGGAPEGIPALAQFLTSRTTT